MILKRGTLVETMVDGYPELATVQKRTGHVVDLKLIDRREIRRTLWRVKLPEPYPGAA